LLGMRERVAALGGHLSAEPRGEGGFSVHAELPVERAP
jgi:signal transduction histidine kinase